MKRYLWKVNQNNNKINIWKLSLKKVKETKPFWKTCLLKNLGSFVGKYFHHFKSLYDQNIYIFFGTWILFIKAWYPLKLLNLLKLAISTNKQLFWPACAQWMWLEKRVYIWGRQSPVSFKKLELTCVCLCFCVCNGNMSPIVFLAEDKRLKTN